MIAGTNSARTIVASTRIAKATPTPSCLIFVTLLDTNAAKMIVSNAAAAVMIRPERCKPKTALRI
jgi:hypothetical protein